MVLEEVDNDIKQLGDQIVLLFGNESYKSAANSLRYKWGASHKPWVFSEAGVEETLCRREKLEAEKSITLVPEARLKDFNIVKRLMEQMGKLGSHFTPLDKASRGLEIDSELPGKFKVIEEWGTEFSSYNTYLVYNSVFHKKMIVKTLKEGRYKEKVDFLTTVSMWRKISDHPNILSIYYIEYLNSIPFISLEYLSSVSIQRNPLLPQSSST